MRDTNDGDEPSADPVAPAIAVALATRNGARHLAAQLASLRAQTWPPAELVVSDDASTDDTIAMVDRFRADAPFPVVLLRNPHPLGFGDNFLQAATATTAPWIAFCDQDDEWDRDKLRAVAGAVAADPGLVLVTHPSRLLRGDVVTDEVIGPRPAGIRDPRRFKPLGVISGHALVFRRDLLAILPVAERPPAAHAPGHRMPHDDWITFLATALGRTAVLDEALVRYRVHDANVSGIQNRRAGRLRSWHSGFRSDIAEVDRQREATAARAAQLGRVATADAAIAAEAGRSARFYATLADTHARRARAWRGSTALSRAAAFACLALRGTYRPVRWGGAGVRDTAKDLLFGIPGRRRTPVA